MTDAADDFDALFEEVAAQRASAPAPAPAPAPEPAAGGDSGDDDDLEALFDQVASSAAPAAAPPVVTPVAAPVAAPAASVATGHEGTDDPDGQMMYARLGSIVRIMHDSLRELGYDKALTEASSQIVDAQDRLEYVATLTEQAANKVLNTLDDGMPAQDQLSKQAKDMEGRWADLFAGKLSIEQRLTELHGGVASSRRTGVPSSTMRLALKLLLDALTRLNAENGPQASRNAEVSMPTRVRHSYQQRLNV